MNGQLEALELRPALIATLKAGGIKNVRDLLSYSETSLTERVANIGPLKAKEIKQAVEAKGLSLGAEVKKSRNMQMFTVTWDMFSEEAKIVLTSNFKQGHRILKLDVLQDAIYDLEKLYSKTLKEK